MDNCTFFGGESLDLSMGDCNGTGNGTESEQHEGFLHAFVESLSVILVSELGDKTFFIAAILAMTNNKITVFLSAITALATMTVLSALLGYVITSFIPPIYTFYACTAIMFLFGFKMLWDAWRMKPNEIEEIQQEVEMEISNRNGPTPQDPETAPDADAAAAPASPAPSVREKSLFGKQCVKIFKLFVNGFVMTFLAEWGDRSQLATIVLAGINDVSGIIIGGTLGHMICTGLAVICGALIAKKISVRAVTFIGALVFIGLAIASLIWFDPQEQDDTLKEVYKAATEE